MATLPNLIFSDASFPNVGAYRYLVPSIAGVTGVPQQPYDASGPVQLTLSDGRLVTVFNSGQTAARCLEKMRLASQSFLIASDDVIIIAISWTKLLIGEASLTFQRLMTSFSPWYANGVTRFTHRNLSSIMTLGDALSSVGFAALAGNQLQTNLDLAAAQCHCLVWDYRYRSQPTTGTPGTLLDDTSQNITYSWNSPSYGSAPVIPAIPPHAAPP